MDRFMWTGIVLILVTMQFSGCYALPILLGGNESLNETTNLSDLFSQINSSYNVSTTDLPSDFTTYSGSRFQIDYPSNWIRIDGLTFMGLDLFGLESDNTFLSAVIPELQIFAPLSGTDVIVVTEFNFQNLGVTLPFTREIIDELVDGIVNTDTSNGSYEYLGEVTVGDLTGYEYAISGKDISGRADVFSQNGSFYLIYYMSQSDQGIPDFYETIFNSFSVVNPDDESMLISLSPERTPEETLMVTNNSTGIPTVTPLS